VADDDATTVPVRAAVEFVVAALAGAVTPEEVDGGLAPRLTARGDVGRMLAGSPRLAVFREHGPHIEHIEIRHAWSGRAAVRTGPALWELDVDVEPVPPHRVLSFQPRRVPDDAVAWSTVSPTLPATRDDDISRRLADAADALQLAGLTAGIAMKGEVVYEGQFGVADLVSREPLRPESVFRVGSVTKAITGLAALSLAQQGIVDLDARVSLPSGICCCTAVACRRTFPPRRTGKSCASRGHPANAPSTPTSATTCSAR
jgi:hypothetical protein